MSRIWSSLLVKRSLEMMESIKYIRALALALAVALSHCGEPPSHEWCFQLVKFNRSLGDLSKEATPRTIDGIVLTKFDTIDDKVGAAISMTYSTGHPIMFVGVGQTCKRARLHLALC